MARKVSVNITADVSLQKIANTEGLGFLIVTGDLGGGILSFFVDFSNGADTPNPWLDRSGTQYTTTAPSTVPFDLTIFDQDHLDATVHATLSGSTSPDLDVLIIDNRGASNQ